MKAESIYSPKTCGLCLCRTSGRQWKKQKAGFGICPECVARFRAERHHSTGELLHTEEKFKKLYGEYGTNHNV